MAMSQQISGEASLMIYSFVLGAVLTFVYDLLRISRRLLPRGKWMVAFEDLFYWTASALCVFLLLHLENDGSLRGFALIGLALGVILYGKILSPYVVKLLVFLLGKLFRFLFWPFGKILKIFKKLLKRVQKSVKVTMYQYRTRRKGKSDHGSTENEL